ncbi:hypothetical protein [Bartonella sp. AC330YNZD]|uniref:hypothetical protein n=1 Tax=Bartonella sp. AC330YNZD TaxID=3243453 RepID=UPI0035D0E7A3
MPNKGAQGSREHKELGYECESILGQWGKISYDIGNNGAVRKQVCSLIKGGRDEGTDFRLFCFFEFMTSHG